MLQKPLYPIWLFLGVLLAYMPAQAQRKAVSELTLVYEYTAAKTGQAKQEGTEYAVHTIFVKGNLSRSEMISPLFSSTTIFDANTGFAVILKEINGQKLLIRLNPDNWKERNRLYDNIVFKNTTEAKMIASYHCIKAVGQTASGITITVWYTRDLVVENRQYDPAFRALDGVPLEYEYTNGDVRIHYKLGSISFNPVPASKFDIPSSGYREMKYEESTKAGG